MATVTYLPPPAPEPGCDNATEIARNLVAVDLSLAIRLSAALNSELSAVTDESVRLILEAGSCVP
jgi:hypothetical protein